MLAKQALEEINYIFIGVLLLFFFLKKINTKLVGSHCIEKTVSSLDSFLNQFSPPYTTCSIKVNKERKVTHQPKVHKFCIFFLTKFRSINGKVK